MICMRFMIYDYDLYYIEHIYHIILNIWNNIKRIMLRIFKNINILM